MKDKALIFNIQHYSLHDGPGIRTIVFFKGCPLRCKWCCNPESQNQYKEIYYSNNKCIGCTECGYCKDECKNNAIKNCNGKISIDREKCNNCLLCAKACPSKAINIWGMEKTIDEILDIVEKDSVFYKYDDGGLTLSGGEVLLQGEFAIELLKEAKKRRINTNIETCGFGDYNILKEIAKYLDNIFFDIKSLDDEKHKLYTGVSNKNILSNFEKLCIDFPDLNKRVRTPVIPGFNDSKEELYKITEYLKKFKNVQHEFLKYHTYGVGKYETLGRKYLMNRG